MNGSRILPRILTALIGLVLAPLSLALLADGSRTWNQYVQTTFYRLGRVPDLTEPMVLRGLGLILIGILLLVILTLTGVWSSAGLLVTAVYALPAVATAAVPALMEAFWSRSPILPTLVLDAIGFGLPVALLPITAAMGGALALARRRPAAPAITALLGMIAVPAMLLLGALALVWGYSRGVYQALMTFDFRLDVVAAVCILVGAVLIVLGILVTRWSPYSLVLPGLAVPALSAVVLLPDPAIDGLLSNRAGATVWTFLSGGGGPALGALFLVFTIVLASVRFRARRAARQDEVVAPETLRPPEEPASPLPPTAASSRTGTSPPTAP
ncbi:hypothetical protein [Brachybacterium phenoliresistens]|uniref:hypothetical protein n=1 Tax=Brachybacterium phenoliresistens TaxID=396014 RepID=UPI0031D415EE